MAIPFDFHLTAGAHPVPAKHRDLIEVFRRYYQTKNTTLPDDMLTAADVFEELAEIKRGALDLWYTAQAYGAVCEFAFPNIMALLECLESVVSETSDPQAGSIRYAPGRARK